MISASSFFTNEYFDQFHTKKYNNHNPLQRRQIGRLLERVVTLAKHFRPKTVLDAGGGEGFLTGYLAASFPDAAITVVDLSSDDLGRLRARLPKVETIVGNLETFDLGRQFDVLIATEVLEHLPRAREALRRFAQHAARIIVTVPHEPLFMATNFLRGKNFSRFGNDPEHMNHWSPRSLRRFLETELIVDRVDTVFPWIVAAGHRRTLDH